MIIRFVAYRRFVGLDLSMTEVGWLFLKATTLLVSLLTIGATIISIETMWACTATYAGLSEPAPIISLTTTKPSKPTRACAIDDLHLVQCSLDLLSGTYNWIGVCVNYQIVNLYARNLVNMMPAYDNHWAFFPSTTFSQFYCPKYMAIAIFHKFFILLLPRPQLYIYILHSCSPVLTTAWLS